MRCRTRNANLPEIPNTAHKSKIIMAGMASQERGAECPAANQNETFGPRGPSLTILHCRGVYSTVGQEETSLRAARMLALLTLIGCLSTSAGPAIAMQQQPSPPQRKPANLLVGMVIAIQGNSLTVKPDAGAPVTVPVSDSAHILRSKPGATTVAGATPIPFSGISIGDRVLMALHPAPNGSGQIATTVIAMKRADIVRQQVAEESAWREHGVGGIVKSVDAAAGTVTISSQRHILTIHTDPKTVIRRYSPTSIQYSESTRSTLGQIRPGDQLRVLGTRSADGNDIQAEKIVSGSFRNIAGVIVSVDAPGSSIAVTDRATNRPVVIQITPDTQMHKLPPDMAKMLAARFTSRKSRRNEKHARASEAGSGSPGSAEAAGENGHASLSQILHRTPVIQLSDLRKGDSVMIVANQGAPNDVIAYTLLNGVGAFLNGSSAGANNLFSASWSLGGQGGAPSSGEAPPTNH